VIVDVIRARLHTTCNDPIETLQLNQRPVIESTVQWFGLCHVEQLDQLQTDLEENAGNFAREVKPLMRQGKHSSDVCLPLPNIPATTDQHFTVAPCTSPITLFSMYNVMVCPKVHPINIMVLTLNSFPYAL